MTPRSSHPELSSASERPTLLGSASGESAVRPRRGRVGDQEFPEQYRERNELFARMLDEPTIGPELRARYMDTLDQQYEFDALFATIDEWVAENHDSALRDQQQWGQAYTHARLAARSLGLPVFALLSERWTLLDYERRRDIRPFCTVRHIQVSAPSAGLG